VRTQGRTGVAGAVGEFKRAEDRLDNIVAQRRYIVEVDRRVRLPPRTCPAFRRVEVVTPGVANGRQRRPQVGQVGRFTANLLEEDLRKEQAVEDRHRVHPDLRLADITGQVEQR